MAKTIDVYHNIYVEQAAFLAKAVRYKRLKIKEATTFDSYYLSG